MRNIISLSLSLGESLAQSYSQLCSQENINHNQQKLVDRTQVLLKPGFLVNVMDNGSEIAAVFVVAWLKKKILCDCISPRGEVDEHVIAISHNLNQNIQRFIIVLAATANLRRRVSHLLAVTNHNNTLPSQKGLKGQSKGSHYHCTITKPRTFSCRLREVIVDFA